MISVSMGPGASTFTVMPYGPSSRAPPRHIPITAAFAVAYTPLENVPPPSKAVIEDVLTMRPTPCGIIRAAAALSIRKEPVTFTAITRSNSARLHSWSGTGQGMPARLTRPTTGGSSESICWYASVTADSEAMSVGTASRFSWPDARSSFSTPDRPSALMSTNATCQPFSARTWAVTRPMPAGPPAPVTTAVRSSGNRDETVDVSGAGADVIAAPYFWSRVS